MYKQKKNDIMLKAYQAEYDGEISKDELGIIIECVDIVLEKSHGKLKFDFRKGYDWKTGHGVKVVYSLEGINVTHVGNGYASQHPEENKEKIKSDIQKNITRKGNCDHASTNQKVLAIVDRVTGKRLQEIDMIGPFAPQVCSGVLKIPNLKSLHDYYNSKGSEFIKKYITHIKVGAVDKNSSFKSTKWFKNSESSEDYYGLGVKVPTDNTIERGTAAESLKYGRGEKLNRISGSNFIGKPVKYDDPKETKNKKR